jgi:CarD family transcriptional regulator
VTFTAGDKVVYPSQGPCLIGPIVERIVDDRPRRFYQLIILDKGGNLFVPVDKVKAAGIRLLLDKSEIPRLLDQLKKPVKAADNWKQRTLNDSRLFASGSAFDLAEIIETLTALGETKSLSIGERSRLDKAKRLLVCEIAEVTGGTMEEAETEIDNALKARKEEATRTPLRKSRDRAGYDIEVER